MKVVEGFDKAKSVLSRQAPKELFPLTAELKRSLKELYGIEEDPEQFVREIVDEVRVQGDKALLHYAKQFGNIKLSSLEITRREIRVAYALLRLHDPKLVSALKLAAKRIRSFHKAQKESIWGKAIKSGIIKVRPLERVGVYAPGGTASYPSTVLMTAIPAKIAGVKEVILTTPPGKNGKVPPATLVAADIAGVDRIFAVGGAQAIAALAFGTQSIPKVDKICGPGNIFVVLAKKLVYGLVGIDGLQGPSEVLIIADAAANPVYCAAELLAQAEHDPLASAVLVTTSRRLAEEVEQQIKSALGKLPRKSTVAKSLDSRGIIAVIANMEQAIELANLYAPEHLCLMVKNAPGYVDRLTNAGCIFVGEKSSVVFGDYIAGPSHVLPTGGTARFSSPLNVNDFIKITNVVSVDEADLNELGQAVEVIARAEGLEAHARAVEKRMGGKKDD